MLPIAQELGWPAGTQGVVQSAFLWGYLATQLLGGTLADRYGGAPRSMSANHPLNVCWVQARLGGCCCPGCC